MLSIAKKNKILKPDIILIIIVLTIASITLLISSFLRVTDNLFARVYLENNLVLELDLHSKTDEIYDYEVILPHGDVIIIQASHNRIRIVDNDHCNNTHICSHNWSSDSLRPIVCLPNRLSIRLISSNPDMGVDF